MKSELIAALDIGSTKVACVAVQADGGEIVLRAASSAPCQGVKRGVIMDFQATANAVDAAVRDAEAVAGESFTRLVVGIGSQHVEGMTKRGFVPIFPRGRMITRDDVLQVINHSRQITTLEGREQIQALPREFRVDTEGGVRNPIGMTGSRLEAATYIVTGQSVHIQNLEKTLSMAGRRVDQMVLQSMASGLAVLSPDSRDKGAAVIDIGGSSTEVAVFQGGAVAESFSIPIGAQLVTSDLSKLLKTSVDEAERLKLDCGCALARLAQEGETVEVLQLGQTQMRPLQKRVLCEIIEARMRELATMVRQHLDNSGYLGALDGGVALTGGGALLVGTVSLFDEVLGGLHVHAARPETIGQGAEIANHPAMATAVGLALFVGQSYDDELSPAAGAGDWKDRIHTFWSLLSGRA
jgi:cell division protein FtsA